MPMHPRVIHGPEVKSNTRERHTRSECRRKVPEGRGGLRPFALGFCLRHVQWRATFQTRLLLRVQSGVSDFSPPPRLPFRPEAMESL